LLFNLRKEPDFYYSFLLEGFDNDWTYWTPHPVKEYTNLGSGRYSLKVRIGSQGMVYSEETLFWFQIKKPLFLYPYFLILYCAFLIMCIWLLYRVLIKRHINRQIMLEQLVQSRTEELKDEKERTESLLANVLPKGTADEIMSKGKATKKKFNFATVLFSDIQGFTRIAEEVNPEILIDELDKFFFYFDNVVEKYNIEKIKTIGDAYMCAGGIPKKNRTNPIEVILAAIEMQEFMENHKQEQKERGQIYWDIRIGLHTGTVIAGVVGQKKLSYDIWGDTVNTASRMESSGEAGKINISGTTYEYAREFFICEYRGKMPVKYKGELDMYFVNGIRPVLRLEGKNEPNDVFKNKLLVIRLLDLEDEVFGLFENNGSKDLIFHDIRYMKNISTQAELIGRAEMLKDEDLLILRLASIFVKSGYMIDYNNFEKESLNLLKEKAPEYSFSTDQIELAADILSEALSDKPESQAGQILYDSINDYMGRVDYIIRLELLFSEKKSMVGLNDKKSWFTEQLDHLSSFNFITSTAKLLRTNSVEKQVEVLKDYINKL
jgi:class 3 adenylate cyclase